MHIKVDFPACVLRPGGTVEVPITFCPREEASYHELIPFEINGFCKQTVEVRGRGTEMKVRYLIQMLKLQMAASMAFSSFPQPTIVWVSAMRVTENLFCFFPFA